MYKILISLFYKYFTIFRLNLLLLWFLNTFFIFLIKINTFLSFKRRWLIVLLIICYHLLPICIYKFIIIRFIIYISFKYFKIINFFVFCCWFWMFSFNKKLRFMLWNKSFIHFIIIFYLIWKIYWIITLIQKLALIVIFILFI